MGGGWNPHFLRPFNDWEIELVNGFIGLIKKKKVCLHIEDRTVWKKAKWIVLRQIPVMCWRVKVQPLLQEI